MDRSGMLEIEGIGPVLFERSVKARRVNITVRPFKGVRVAVPRGVPLREAEEFLHSKAGWVKKHLGRMRAAEREHDAFRSVAPVGREEAGRMLAARLGELSKRHGLAYNRLFIRSQKTQWGSCSARKNISLNMRLVELPDELIDYVIIHELVHTRVMNHGKAFWTALERHVPDARKVDAKLRKYRLVLG
ncbi:MAG: M48 family metallopeptidase [Thermodesulfobacteriota bacterium]